MNRAATYATHALEARVEAVTRLPNAVKIAVIAAAAVVAFVIPRLAGGSPTPMSNLGYAPILLAAYFYGWRGGLVSSVVMSVVIGPLPGLLRLPSLETMEATITRGAFFIALGTVTGALFDRSRRATIAWRDAALTVAKREREAIIALARGAEAKDVDTGGHINRVQRLTSDFALALGLDGERAADLGWSAMLHDVGKLHVPDQILLKPGALSAAEIAIMRRHTIWGAEILANGDAFEVARSIARWHHENIDGTGYPDHLRGASIPLEARIVRVADAFDAMTNHRPYRNSITTEQALEELDRFADRQFDPELVRVFVNMVRANAVLLRPGHARLGAQGARPRRHPKPRVVTRA